MRLPGLRHSSRGFSLVELMVAITVGLIVLGGATTVMVNSNKNYKIQEDLARIQENARFAMEFLTRDIRETGYFGCIDDVSQVWDHVVGGSGTLFDTKPIEGSESAGNWLPLSPTPVAAPSNMVPGTDGITLRKLDPSTALNIGTPYMGQPSGNIKVIVPPSGDTGLIQGDIVAVTDCDSTDIFQISNNNPDAGVLVHSTGNSTSPGNTSAGCPNLGAGNSCSTGGGGNIHCLCKVYEGEAQIVKFIAVRYFIGTTPQGTTALFRQGISVVGGTAAAQDLEVVEGIENLQILYGRDTDGDGIPDQYRDAASIGTTEADWAGVVSVRIGLLAGSVDELGNRFDQDHGTYDIDRDGTNDLIDPGDRRRRRIFTATVLMRNLQ